MASIETLIAQIDDAALREKLGREVAEMKRRLDWGLVFERHLPENVRALSAPIRPGSVVWERRAATPRRLRVRAIDGPELVVVPEPEKTTAPADAATERILRTEVLVEQDFADPVFPVPTPIGAVRSGPADAPYHVVIEGENYHAIQALLAAYDRSFDLIYLDPPYNTGNRDWSYNNDYVDTADTFRPSKWLAFMERRLRIARRLLRPDGVLVVTIDENEVHHLGMLLDQLFIDYDRQMLTMVTNPKGTIRGNFGRVEEYAFFCVPRTDQALIAGRLVEGPPDDDETEDDEEEDLPVETTPTDQPADEDPEPATDDYEFQLFRRRGSASMREDRWRRFFPIWIDEAGGRIVAVGDTLPLGEEPDMAVRDGLRPIWPIDSEGNQRVWRWQASRVRALLDGPDAEGRYLVLGRYNAAVDNWTINLAVPRSTTVKQKSVWWEKRHDSGTHGTTLLSKFLGKSRQFAYPKSLYLVRDTLDLVVRDRPNALILDFFAGSGTTLHATALLNLDGGHRRCVLVTNNELDERSATRLTAAGHFRGDTEWEAAGVFEKVTRPRVEAAITGTRPDGRPVVGRYLDRRPFASGLPANVEFYRLDYLDPAEVEFGLRYRDIEPLLWLRAGGIGEREPLDPSQPLGLPAHSPYAVLFDPAGLPDLAAALPERSDITHVFIVADSPESFAQIASDLPGDIEKVRLYRDYLETLRGATR